MEPQNNFTLAIGRDALTAQLERLNEAWAQAQDLGDYDYVRVVESRRQQVLRALLTKEAFTTYVNGEIARLFSNQTILDALGARTLLLGITKGFELAYRGLGLALPDWYGPEELEKEQPFGANIVPMHRINQVEESVFERFLREHPAPKPAPGRFPEQVFPDGYQRFKRYKEENPTLFDSES